MCTPTYYKVILCVLNDKDKPMCNDVAEHNACPATITNCSQEQQTTRLLPFLIFIQDNSNT